MQIATPAPGFAPTTQQRWLLSIGLVVALLQGAIFAVIDPDLAGWNPHHSHITIGGYVVEHTHPWDAHHGHGPGLVDPAHEGDGHDAVVFGGISDSLGVTAPALATVAGVIRSHGGLIVALPTDQTGVLVDHPPLVPTPPPRS